MAEHPYTGADRHRQIHADLVGQVEELKERYHRGQTTLTLPVMNFLEDWLLRHIQEEDYQFVQELKAQGIR